MSKDIFLIKSALAKNKDTTLVNLYNIDSIILDDNKISFFNGSEKTMFNYNSESFAKTEFEVLKKAATSLDMFNNI